MPAGSLSVGMKMAHGSGRKTERRALKQTRCCQRDAKTRRTVARRDRERRAASDTRERSEAPHSARQNALYRQLCLPFKSQSPGCHQDQCRWRRESMDLHSERPWLRRETRNCLLWPSSLHGQVAERLDLVQAELAGGQLRGDDPADGEHRHAAVVELAVLPLDRVLAQARRVAKVARVLLGVLRTDRELDCASGKHERPQAVGARRRCHSAKAARHALEAREAEP
mmetsp:Transcript_45042/g.118999  ORF Transcript_45042/g.118999 Transcript_45042/m.118999 type:complete len:226 (+) Transcript_45042:32-709(+)